MTIIMLLITLTFSKGSKSWTVYACPDKVAQIGRGDATALNSGRARDTDRKHEHRLFRRQSDGHCAGGRRNSRRRYTGLDPPEHGAMKRCVESDRVRAAGVHQIVSGCHRHRQ